MEKNKSSNEGKIVKKKGKEMEEKEMFYYVPLEGEIIIFRIFFISPSPSLYSYLYGVFYVTATEGNREMI